jgi:hypothetical protein
MLMDGVVLDRPGDSVNETVHRGQQAWIRLHSDNAWVDWVDVGKAHVIGRQEAMREAHVNEPSGHRYKVAFAAWLEKFGFRDLDDGDRARLFKVMDNLAAVEKWRAELGTTKRLRLNHPSTVLRKWQAATTAPSKDRETPKKPTRTKKLEQSLAAALEENHKLKREVESGGGDLWSVHDRAEDIAAVMAAKLSANKFDQLIKAMEELKKRRMDSPRKANAATKAKHEAA